MGEVGDGGELEIAKLSTEGLRLDSGEKAMRGGWEPDLDEFAEDDDGAGDVFIGVGFRDGDGKSSCRGRGNIEGRVVGHEKQSAAWV